MTNFTFDASDPRFALALEAERNLRNAQLEHKHGNATDLDVQLAEFKLEVELRQARAEDGPWVS